MPRQGILANRTMFDMMLVLGGALFVALCAQIRIPLPFSPVPITGQTLGVLLTGSLLGTRLGLLSMVLYVALGAIGLPFYAGGSGGIEVLQGATAGYLFSYPLAAALVGWLAQRGLDRKASTTVLSMVLGNIVIYTLGVGWLALYPEIGGLGNAMMLGMVPFLIGDAIKIVIAAGVLPAGWKLLANKNRD